MRLLDRLALGFKLAQLIGALLLSEAGGFVGSAEFVCFDVFDGSGFLSRLCLRRVFGAFLLFGLLRGFSLLCRLRFLRVLRRFLILGRFGSVGLLRGVGCLLLCRFLQFVGLLLCVCRFCGFRLRGVR